MNPHEMPTSKLIWFLQERAKELSCLYRIEEVLSRRDSSLDDVCQTLIEVIPPGWQYPEVCQARIMLFDKIYQAPGFAETPWMQRAEIKVFDEKAGYVCVLYTKEMPASDQGPFLKEEAKLITTIAERIGGFVAYQQMRRVFQEYKTAAQDLIDSSKPDWRVVLDLLEQTDRNLYLRIAHKMLNHLCWTGIDEAKRLLRYYSPGTPADEELYADSNVPFRKTNLVSSNSFLCDETFKIAEDNLPPTEMLTLIQKWVQQDKLNFLTQSLVSLNSTISEVIDTIRRYQRMAPEGIDIPFLTKQGVLVSLIRRFFSDQLHFIHVAKNHIDLDDIFGLLGSVIYTPDSLGMLGGKSAGLFLAAQILRKEADANPRIGEFKVPKTWYIASDVLMHFIHYNNFEEVNEQKYKEINQVRLEYPNVLQTFKNAHFPPDIIKQLSVALDDFGEVPLIVRSSSLLEDRAGSAFSGKYRSLFLPNQGEKQQRLEDLMDAIAEVYASVFGPDPIEYRADRGLTDFHEEMAIMIQEVVGTRVGRYFMPAYAGVAFSKNELRWSPRIKREDGLVRLVLGLGTRAVDRLSDDYTVLVSPGQPGLRVNVTTNDVVRYAPRKIDAINLEKNTFETVLIADVLKEFGSEFPLLQKIVSVAQGDQIRTLPAWGMDNVSGELVPTFDGLFSQTPFLAKMQAILKTLEEKIGSAIDIEFACDGIDFYLLQCRPQSHGDDSGAARIPTDAPPDRILFTANRYVTNGTVPEITHLVYVDPQKYTQLSDRSAMLAVGRAISQLNVLLPKRQFILMGPGRWGSRGDIKLGVSVTYSDISNSAMLIEVARKSGHYTPDLSFGTHFFQDLVEAQIRYLPLYPDDKDIIFNEKFFTESDNLLAVLLPEFAYLSEVLHLIDVPKAADGRILQVLMNADQDQAMGLLTLPGTTFVYSETRRTTVERTTESHWRWRYRMAEQIAAEIDAEKFGVKAFYLFGSTKNATAGSGSDIDILIHFKGSHAKREALTNWLEGWSRCLAEMNFAQTGYQTSGLLDVHIITDEDIAAKNSYAVKIGAITDAVKELPVGRRRH